MRQPYTDPTAFLLSLGDPRKIRDPNTSRGWADYIKKFGFSLNDVPTLLQLLKDPTIKAANTNDPLVWADVHAWRALGQLRAVEAIPDLIAFFDYENEYEIEDW
ncbi:MAG TPA: hypothetical protein VJL87_01520, partial [Bdellovibrionota bacterium]|nr:hypothetical protein [Bdellovibrionota bacterium]